jgi:MFS family permease
MSTSTERVSSNRSQVNKAAASGWMGSALEYYDFFVYGSAAALFFPQLFFPKGNPTVAIMTSLATYAVGFLARPFGAFFLGHWGDRHGRKSVLVFSMILMGISTACVGLLPTYEQIGVWAPAMLIVLRLVQGFALGGEQPGANSMVLEHAPFGRRGFYGSFIAQGTQAGQILAAGVFLPLLHFMPQQMFYSIGWRIPFLFSVAIVIVGLFVRRKVDETPEFTKEVRSGQVSKAPILETFRFAWPDMLRIIGMALAYVVPATITVFGAAYAAQPAYGIGFPKELFLWIPVLGNVIAVITIPFAGILSDKIGRRPTFVVGMICSGIATVLYLYAISIHSMMLTFIVSMIAWGVVYQGYNAIVPSFWPELFPTRFRVAGNAISHNIGVVLGSFIPILLVAVAPPGSSNIPLKVGSIAFAVACLSAFAAWSARETYRIRMEDLGNKHAVPVDEIEYERIRIEASRKMPSSQPFAEGHGHS